MTASRPGGARDALRRFLDVARTMGFARALRLTPDWLITRRYIVYAWNLRRSTPPVPAPSGVSWGILDAAEWPRLRELDPSMSADGIRRRAAEAQECVVGWIGGSLAYYRWQTTRAAWLPYLRTTFHTCPGDVLVLEVFTHPHLRGRGIGEYASRQALERAHTMGHRRAVWLTAWWNTPAIRIAHHPDYRVELGTVGYVNLGPIRRYFATGDVHVASDGIRLDPGPWPSDSP
jgi:GNAT superfamily N-acetyltransferase